VDQPLRSLQLLACRKVELEAELGSGMGESGLAIGMRRVQAAALLLLAPPGSACLDQGEEIGLWQLEDLSTDVLQGPIVTAEGLLSADGPAGCGPQCPDIGSPPAHSGTGS
jgi:hypothetical protein